MRTNMKWNRKTSAFLILAGLVLFSCSQVKENKVDYSWVYDNIEFDMPRVAEPVIPSNSINIADLGAVGDGVALNTQFFAEAIEKLSAKGGGSVIVPPGLWLTGPIVLKNNINIHVEDGALVRFSKNFDDYPLVESTFEGIMTYRCQSPISGRDLENVSFTGKGVFDGNGQAWRPVKRFKMTSNQWRNLVNSGGVLNDKQDTWWPSEQALQGFILAEGSNIPALDTFEEYLTIKDFLRPVMVSLINCKKVLFDGPTFQNSPAWNLHPLMCEDVTIRNLVVRNQWFSQNGDGLDLESCKNVVIHNNSFDVGDDAICFKSGRDKEGRDRGMPTQNVIVKNNIVYAGHGGFVIGSEMSGGVRNVHVSACTFMGTNIGLRFKSTRGRGGAVENIYISDINMIDIPTEPIQFNLFYGGFAPVLDDGSSSSGLIATDAPAVSVTEETPVFRNIVVKNVVANGFGNAALFMGLPEMKLENVRLENAVLKAPKGFTCIDVEGVEFVNVRIIQESGPAMTLFNSQNVSLDNFSFENNGLPGLAISGASTQNITVSGKDFSSPDSQIMLVGGASRETVVVR